MKPNNYLDKQTKIFVENKIGIIHSVTRLNDRFFREDLKKTRKSVYLLKSNTGNINVLLKFSKRYKKIFTNYIIAQQHLKKLTFINEWTINRNKLLILMPYFGKNLLIKDVKSRNRIIKLLRKINKPARLDFFKTPRYISKLIEINLVKQTFNFNNLEKLVDIMNGRKILYGLGIEDPSFNNFTEVNKKVFLVDLDNFDSHININYQIGFLDADLDMATNGSLSKEFYFINQDVMYFFGFISRYSTVLIDYLSGRKLDHAYIIFCNDTIQKISQFLLKILL